MTDESENFEEEESDSEIENEEIIFNEEELEEKTEIEEEKNGKDCQSTPIDKFDMKTAKQEEKKAREEEKEINCIMKTMKMMKAVNQHQMMKTLN